MSTASEEPKAANPADVDFDPKAMNERYRIEREKRLRPFSGGLPGRGTHIGGKIDPNRACIHEHSRDQ